MQEELKKKMSIHLDFNNMMCEFVKDGVKTSEIDAEKENIEKAKKAMVEKRKQGMMDFRDLPYNQDKVVADILETADKIKKDFDNFVVLGIGGSALGPIAIQQALNDPHYNELTKEQRNGFPRIYVEDNVDPDRIDSLLKLIDVKKTAFNIITKSGNTSETMSQFFIVLKLLKDQTGENYKEHIFVTTDSPSGSLYKIATNEGFKMFKIPQGVGGRFSELTPVGLLPAAVAGIDIKEMLEGAAYMDKICSNQDVKENPAFLGAILQYISMKKGKNISVMMPYSDSLKYIADWYAQLWAESLGKKYSLQHKEVYAGQTPVKALGVTDQHSQVQLYTEGPFDKVITFIRIQNFKNKMEIPQVYPDVSAISFLGGHSLSELINIEQTATEYALQKSGKMNRTILLPEVNAFVIGQLLYYFEVETAFTGELLNINTFDQPGVEEGKNAAYAILGRPGYDEKKKELDSKPEKNKDYII